MVLFFKGISSRDNSLMMLFMNNAVSIVIVVLSSSYLFLLVFKFISGSMSS